MNRNGPLPELLLSSLAYTFGHWLPREGREDHFDLNAPYQRGSVWTLDQRRALIKSLYMGLPIGVIIVSKLPFRSGSPYHYRIVDGKQRIETIRAFANDEFSVPDAEILVAEAELYGLVNGGGTVQTEADMERARLVAEGVGS